MSEEYFVTDGDLENISSGEPEKHNQEELLQKLASVESLTSRENSIDFKHVRWLLTRPSVTNRLVAFSLEGYFSERLVQIGPKTISMSCSTLKEINFRRWKESEAENTLNYRKLMIASALRHFLQCPNIKFITIAALTSSSEALMAIKSIEKHCKCQEKRSIVIKFVRAVGQEEQQLFGLIMAEYFLRINYGIKTKIPVLFYLLTYLHPDYATQMLLLARSILV